MDTHPMKGEVVIGRYQHVVHIDDEPSFMKLFFKNCVHHHLEGGWRVG